MPVAGAAEDSGFAGDGGPATAARLKAPRAAAFDDAGNLGLSLSNSVLALALKAYANPVHVAIHPKGFDMFLRHAIAGLTLAAAMLFPCAGPARAQSGGLGPGPIQILRLTDRGLVITSAPLPKGVAFEGDVVVSATRDASGWTRFDEAATVEPRQIVQPGTIGGVTADEFFAAEQPARILVRNGDGEETELDVARLGDQLAITRVNRELGAPVTSVTRSASKEVDALEDASITLPLKTDATESGLDVVVTVALPAMPDNVSRQFPALVAIDGSGASHEATTAPHSQSPTAAFFHLILGEGSYTLVLSERIAVGNPLVSTTLVSVDHIAELPIDVSAESRLFALTSPPVELPALADGTLTVDGLGQLGPAFGSPLNVALRINSADQKLWFVADRKATDSDPVAIPIRLPPGTYTIRLWVGKSDGQPNGRSLSFGVTLDERELPESVAVTIPPLVRLSGTIRDPGLLLAADPAPISGDAPSHSILAAPADGTEGFVSEATVRGFARSYELFVPRGATVRLSESLVVKVGRQPSKFRSWENATVTVADDAAVEPIVCDADRTVDVEVPEVPPHVTLSGTAVDPRGKPARQRPVDVSGSVGGAGPAIKTFVVTNDKGEFRLRLPRGRGYRLTSSRR